MLLQKNYNGKGNETIIESATGAIVWDGLIDATNGAIVFRNGKDEQRFENIKTTIGIFIIAAGDVLRVEYSGRVDVYLDYAELEK